eukprot:5164512-Pyramimonas_sp.AAC.1
MRHCQAFAVRSLPATGSRDTRVGDGTPDVDVTVFVYEFGSTGPLFAAPLLRGKKHDDHDHEFTGSCRRRSWSWSVPAATDSRGLSTS